MIRARAARTAGVQLGRLLGRLLDRLITRRTDGSADEGRQVPYVCRNVRSRERSARTKERVSLTV